MKSKKLNFSIFFNENIPFLIVASGVFAFVFVFQEIWPDLMFVMVANGLTMPNLNLNWLSKRSSPNYLYSMLQVVANDIYFDLELNLNYV